MSMDNEKRIQEAINELTELSHVCGVCISLLQFKHGSENKKYQLHKAVREFTNGNFNKEKKISKVLEGAEDKEVGNNIENAIGKYFEPIKVAKIEMKYFSSVRSIDDVKKVLNKTLYEIQNVSRLIDSLKEQAKYKTETKEEDDYKVTSSTSTSYPTSSYPYGGTSSVSSTRVEDEYTTRVTPIEDIVSTKEIKERVTVGYGYFKKEVEAVKKEYGLEGQIWHGDFISDDSIRKIIRLHDAEIGISKKYKVKAGAMAEVFNGLLVLAVQELKENTRSDQYHSMRKFANDFGGVDYVQRFTKLYDNFYNYCKGLPEKEREAFKEEFTKHLAVDLKQSDSNLIVPEMFRDKVNEKITEIILNSPSSVNMERLDQLVHQTKYMDAEDIQRLYYKIEQREQQYMHYDCSKQRTVCVELITKRMPDVNINDPKLHEIMEERREAVRKDYFREDNKAIPGTAKRLIEQKETIQTKKKEYFRMSKFKQALQFMNYSKLKQLERKEKLSEAELAGIKGMF